MLIPISHNTHINTSNNTHIPINQKVAPSRTHKPYFPVAQIYCPTNQLTSQLQRFSVQPTIPMFSSRRMESLANPLLGQNTCCVFIHPTVQTINNCSTPTQHEVARKVWKSKVFVFQASWTVMNLKRNSDQSEMLGTHDSGDTLFAPSYLHPHTISPFPWYIHHHTFYFFPLINYHRLLSLPIPFSSILSTP
jgi:hypothetical protein